MPTPVGTTVSYCTGVDFVQRYDVRSIGDRLQDAGIRVSAGNVANDPNLATLLLESSGEVEAAVLRGQRYQLADLQALTGASQAKLKGLVADICLWKILNRRVNSGTPIPKQCEMALKMLEDLGDGVRIFSLQEAMTAGLHVPVLAPNINQLFGFPQPDPISSQANRLFGVSNPGD